MSSFFLLQDVPSNALFSRDRCKFIVSTDCCSATSGDRTDISQTEVWTRTVNLTMLSSVAPCFVVHSNAFHFLGLVQNPTFPREIAWMLPNATLGDLMHIGLQVAIRGFKPKLASYLDRFSPPLLTSIAPRIGVHLRLGGDKVSWKDPPRVDHDFNMSCYVGEVLNACKTFLQKRRICQIYIASDSKIALNNFKVMLSSKTRFNYGFEVAIYNGEGEIAHVDRSGPGGREKYLRVYGDFVILASLDVIIATNGGFSLSAGWFSKIPVYHDKSIKGSCRWSLAYDG